MVRGSDKLVRALGLLVRVYDKHVDHPHCERPLLRYSYILRAAAENPPLASALGPSCPLRTISSTRTRLRRSRHARDHVRRNHVFLGATVANAHHPRYRRLEVGNEKLRQWEHHRIPYPSPFPTVAWRNGDDAVSAKAHGSREMF